MSVFDEIAESYDGLGVDFFTPLGRDLVAAARIGPGERVLDVGCGRGAVLFPAAEAVGPHGHLTGIDLAPSMVALTARDAVHLPWVTVAVGDAGQPGFPPESVDVVTAGLVLFFLPDPGAALHAYRELLRPGGRVAFSTFAKMDPRHREAMRTIAGLAVDPPRPPSHEATFQDPDWLRELVSGAGFGGTVVTGSAVRSDFRDLDHFLAWVGSHAGREVLRRVPAERRPELITALKPVLSDSPSITTSVHLVVARKPGPAE